MASRSPKGRRSRSEEEDDEISVSSVNRPGKSSSPRKKSPSSKASPPPPLQFITLTDQPSSQKHDYSYTVRSHAMQAFLHEKKNANGDKAKEQLEAAKDPQTPKELSGKFKLASWSRKPRTKRAKAQAAKGDSVESTDIKEEAEELQDESQPSAPSTPPQTYSNTLPTSQISSIRTQELLYHCITPPSICPLCLTARTDTTALISNTFNIPYDNNPNITDSALLHATLCLVAQHEDLSRGTEESSENLFHKGEAMRLMNERLLEKWHAISNADITAVAIFVILESINGTFEAASAHRVGLLKMARLMGGIEDFETNGVVLRVLAWSDIVFSTRFGFPPKLSQISKTLNLSSSFTTNSPSPYSSIFTDTPTTSILKTLCYISNTIDLPSLSANDKKSISDVLYQAEYNILTSPYISPDSFQQDQSPQQILTVAFHMAALLYLHIFIRELPSPGLLHSRLLSQLTQLVNTISVQISVGSGGSLENIDPALHPKSPCFGQEEMDVFLWVAFVGVTASSDVESRNLFVIAMKGVEIGKERVRERLRRIIWRERKCEEVLEGMWDEENWY